jgi:hypothetical protein
MSEYLRKYEKVFRVYANYNQATNDFIRDDNGKLDNSFEDFYIKCDSNCKIRQYQKDVLLFYCPTLGRFRNILKMVYEDKIGNANLLQVSTISDKGIERITFNIEAMYKKLLDKGILVYIDEMDFEGEFGFKTEDMKYIAELVGAKTSGANISPFSTRNLPSKKYDIPTEDLSKYKEIINVLEKNELVKVAHITTHFDDVIQAKKGKLYDINAKRKLSCLNGKEFIHSIGLFDEYLKFLKQGILKYQEDKKNSLNTN